MFIYRSFLVCVLLFNTLFSQQKESLSVFFNQVKINSDIYANQSNFKKAQYYFLQKNWDSTLIYSLKQLENSKNKSEIKNYCYLFRGYSFQKKKLFNISQEEFSKVSNDFIFFNHVNAYLGEIFFEQKEFKKAINYFKKVEISNNNKIGIKINNILENIGMCLFHLKSYKKADSYMKKSLDLSLNINDTLALIRSYGNIANFYYEQYKDDIAISYFKKAYKLSKKNKNFDVKRDASLNMSIIEENNKNYKKALAFNIEYHKWKDSVRAEAKQLATMRIDKEEVIRQKQNEVNILQAENKEKTTERNRILYTVVVLLILLSIIIYFFRKNIKSKKIISLQNEKLDALNTTKDKLFSIVSHDLRSSVNTLKLSNKKLIRNLEENNIVEVHQLLQRNSNLVGGAYNLLDNLLNWSLLQTKQSYFEIKENHLFFIMEHVVYNYSPFIKEKQLHFENVISESIKVMADQESLKIILRNLLDNAIKFSKEKGSIKVYSEKTNDGFINIVVQDFGIGMNKKTVEKLQLKEMTVLKKENSDIIGSGLGLQLCKSMIKKNKGKLTIKSELGKGTKMIVSLPKPLSYE